MKNKLCSLFVVCAVLITGCNANTTPLVEDVQNMIKANANDIEIVLNYMISSKYEDVVITDCSGNITVLEQGEYYTQKIDISQESIYSSICNLLQEGNYLSISKMGNTVELLQWRGTQDITCGAAYSIDTSVEPEVQYMTKLEALDDGWYYYVADYNQWRQQKTE